MRRQVKEMAMPKHLTVVYTINDETEFASVRAEIM